MTAGIVNVLKPPGMTSHDVVSFCRRVYGLKKVGHAGTLDPAAAGVLPVFIGPATRLIEFTADADKAYRVELTFGYATDSGDDTGEIIAAAPDCQPPPPEKAAALLASFAGAGTQTPPMHSAIKVGGRKLYELARAGITVERAQRPIFISDIALIRADGPTLLFDVTCSKGTYIRSLCADIGTKAGCPAVMSFLVRTRVGAFDLGAAKALEEIAAAPEACLLSGDTALGHLPRAVLGTDEARAFGHGQAVASPSSSNGPVAVYDTAGRLIGIARQEPASTLLQPVKVLSPHAP